MYSFIVNPDDSVKDETMMDDVKSTPTNVG